MALVRNKWVWIVCIAFLLGFAWAFRPSKPIDISGTGVVARGDLIQRVTIAGSVMPNRKTIFTAPYNGYVRKIYVEVGQKVKEGDPVVTISQSLKGSGDDAFPLRAPFAGTVVQILKSVGEYVEAGGGAQGPNTLVRIDDLGSLYVEALSPEIEIGKLKAGQEVIIRASAILSRSYSGRIRHVALASKGQKDWESSKVEFPVTISLTDADEQLKPGMSVIVDVVASKKEKVLKLAHEFVQKDQDKYFVVMATGDKRPIEVGLQNEEAFEIVKGLNEGDRVRQNDFLAESKEL